MILGLGVVWVFSKKRNDVFLSFRFFGFFWPGLAEYGAKKIFLAVNIFSFFYGH